ncbi:MAG: DUF4382 domain-containing protein, partial [Nitrospira sp.]|nr:DUF4382 domain-containing protein [Nitrospira sp.]
MKGVNSGLKKVASCCVGVMALAAVGCGSDGGGGAATAQPGTVSVSLTDAPACGYKEVWVTVNKVRIHQSSSEDNKNGAGWRDIALVPPRSINLLDLNDPTRPNSNFALEYLGETSLPAGHYTQLRLVLEKNQSPTNPFNYIVLEDNTQEPLDTPSGTQTGIKLIHQFTVGSGQRVDLLLDFDACHSIVKTGNGTYKLKPVIKVIPYALNGIQGTVDKTTFLGGDLVGKHVVASAQFNNGEIARAVAVNTGTGQFFLSHLDSSIDYDVVITADDHAATVITNVPVDDSPNITTINTIIPLNDSGVQGVGGVVTLIPDTDDATVITKAKQTLTSGPTVTVKSTVAEGTGTTGKYAYSMTLPIAAPRLYHYSPMAPDITEDDASQSGAAVMYAIHASAQVITETDPIV